MQLVNHPNLQIATNRVEGEYMASLVLLCIIVLWLLGYIQVPYLHTVIFTLFDKPITLYTVLLFLIIAWIIEILPTPLRQIIFVLFLLWVLSIFGIIVFAGQSQLIVAAIIIGVIVSFFR